MNLIRSGAIALCLSALHLLPLPALAQRAPGDYDVLGLRMGMTREEVRDALPVEWLERKASIQLYSIDANDKPYGTEKYVSRAPDEYVDALPADAPYFIAIEWIDNGHDDLHLAYDGQRRLISVELNLPKIPDAQLAGVYEQAIRKFGVPTDFRGAFTGNEYRVSYYNKMGDMVDGQHDFYFKPDCRAEHEAFLAAASKDAQKAAAGTMGLCVVASNARWKSQVGPDEIIARMQHHLEDPKSKMYGTGPLLWNCSAGLSDDAFREIFQPDGRVVTANGITTHGVLRRPADEAVFSLARLGIEDEVCAASITRYSVTLQRFDLAALRAAARPDAEVEIEF